MSKGFPTTKIVIRVGNSGDLDVAEDVKLPSSGGQFAETSVNDLGAKGVKFTSGCARRRLGFLEIVGFEVVLFQQVVKVSSIFTGQLGGLTYVAIGHRKNLH